ncbi:MAG: HAMP domain-containing histidine kinase [Blautia sp.]|nr:HAMP domain-containing histidine kinase [Blautia sp.]
MLNRLKKNISLLLLLLVGAIYIACLTAFNWINYRDNVDQLKIDVREEIQEMGWKSFLLGEDNSLEMEGIGYCIFRLEKGGGIELKVNAFPGKSEEQLGEYGKYFVENTGKPKSYTDVTYIFKKHNTLGSYVIFVSKKPALYASFPVMGISVIAAILGILALLEVARLLTRWLVRPVENMLFSEKQFLSNASHELKTPLTVIGANAELLEKEIGENKHLLYIRQEVERMTALVNRMLTLVRLEDPSQREAFECFPAEEAFFDVIYPMESVAYEKKLTLSVDIAQNLYLNGSREQLKSLMSILLDNAIAYTPEGGSISVRAFLRSGRLWLKVKNTGEEIPERVRAQLFERFYRQDDARTGDNHFGLGLSIAQSIVANHHGQLKVESRDGENCFTVTLPAAGKSI